MPKTKTGKHYDGWAYKALRNCSKYGIKKGQVYGGVFRTENAARRYQELRQKKYKEIPDLPVMVCDCLKEVKP